MREAVFSNVCWDKTVLVVRGRDVTATCAHPLGELPILGRAWRASAAMFFGA